MRSELVRLGGLEVYGEDAKPTPPPPCSFSKRPVAVSANLTTSWEGAGRWRSKNEEVVRTLRRGLLAKLS